jgi:nicotinamidase-related amidase
MKRCNLFSMALAFAVSTTAPPVALAEETQRVYRNELRVIENPKPVLADYPQFVQPVLEERHYEAPVLVDDPGADLDVRAWRFSYNARGIIEIPNCLRADQTAVIVVHPWGIDDGQGWRTPEPAGVADFCTPNKNHLAGKHTSEVIDPFLKRLRDDVAFVMYSMRADEKPVHRKLYRSIRHTPTEAEREEGKRELHEILNSFKYEGSPLPETIELSADSPVKDYFAQFPGLDASAKYDNEGFWDLPTPVCSDITVFPQDIVIYDDDGYPALRDFLKANGVKHILLAGYATDMCYCLTTAGYKNLSQDFNVFLVGDATLATFPANNTPQYATNAHISFAALNQLVTQVGWVKLRDGERVTATQAKSVVPAE